MPNPRDPRDNFYAEPTIEELAEQQGVEPITDPTVLLGNAWPDEEPAEDIIRAVREWRGHKDGPTR